ncbi:MAG: OmpA family protein [Thermodesulfobacteriota bacterium]
MKTLITFASIILMCGASAWAQTVPAETWEAFQRTKLSAEKGTGLVAKKSKIIPKGVILEKLRKDREVVFESDAIQFAYGSTVVQDSSASQLAEIAAALTESEDFRNLPFFYVDGHCCNIGSDENNCRLSFERARAVIAALTQGADISESKFRARGFGKRKPAFSNDTEEERSRNRRVVLRSQQAPGATEETEMCTDGESSTVENVPETSPERPLPATTTGGSTLVPEVFPELGTRGAPKSPGFLPSRKPAGSKHMQGGSDTAAASKTKPSIPWADRTAPQQDPNLPEGFIKSKKLQ